MKQLKDIINEKLVITKDTKDKYNYNYFPETKNELRNILKDLLKERGCDADLNDIDTSKITDMSDLFEDLNPREIDISEWDVSHVASTAEMFWGCKNFNSDLSKWDVSRVTNMEYMFYWAKSFDSDLGGWDVSNVESMDNMFDHCYAFKGKGLDKWKLYSHVSLNRTFDKCTSLQKLPYWWIER